MGFRLEESIPLNEFVFIETGEGTSTGVRAEEKAGAKTRIELPLGLRELSLGIIYLPTCVSISGQGQPTPSSFFPSPRPRPATANEHPPA